MARGQKHKVAQFPDPAQGCLRSKAQGCLISRPSTGFPEVKSTRLALLKGSRLREIQSARLLIFCARHKVASGQKHEVA